MHFRPCNLASQQVWSLWALYINSSKCSYCGCSQLQNYISFLMTAGEWIIRGIYDMLKFQSLKYQHGLWRLSNQRRDKLPISPNWNGINFSNKLIWYNGFLAVEAGRAWAGVILSKEIEMIHWLFLVNCYLLHVLFNYAQPASYVGGLVIHWTGLNWLDST